VVVAIRVVNEEDAVALADGLTADRDFLARWDPARPSEYFTESGQRRDIDDQLTAHEQRTVLPYVVEVDGALVGRINVFHIVYKAFCSGTLGYWIRRDHHGRGVATAAVAAMIELAFGEGALHRLEAGTLVDNHASRRVLAKNGFTEIGLAPCYLQIAGRWQDHILHQRLNESATSKESGQRNAG
jgi:[ribosomal protein S5]-alanine N-acetyltransferase